MFYSTISCKGDSHEMFREGVNPLHGKTLQIKGDMRHYYLQRDQKWQPKVVPSINHPVKIGDILTVKDYMVGILGAEIVFVSGIRTLREFRNDTQGARQVELLGLPCRWFPIGLFEEYRYQSLRTNEKVICLGA